MDFGGLYSYLSLLCGYVGRGAGGLLERRVRLEEGGEVKIGKRTVAEAVAGLVLVGGVVAGFVAAGNISAERNALLGQNMALKAEISELEVRAQRDAKYNACVWFFDGYNAGVYEGLGMGDFWKPGNYGVESCEDYDWREMYPLEAPDDADTV